MDDRCLGRKYFIGSEIMGCLPATTKHLSVSLFPYGKMVLLLPFHGAIWESSEELSRGAEKERERERPLYPCVPGYQRLWTFHSNYLP